MSFDNNSSEFFLEEQDEVIVLIENLQEIKIPGLPAPLTGPRFDALVAKIKTAGVLHPLLVDENGFVWDGRSRLRACILLGIKKIKVTYIASTDGPKRARIAAMQRQWSPLEMAQTIQWVVDGVELTLLKQKEPEKKTNYLVSQWMSEELGMVRGVSPRQVTGYLRLARSYPDLTTPTREAIEAAATLNEALKLVPTQQQKKKRQMDQVKACQRALQGLVKAVQKMGNSDAVKGVIAEIQAAMAKVLPNKG